MTKQINIALAIIFIVGILAIAIFYNEKDKPTHDSEGADYFKNNKNINDSSPDEAYLKSVNTEGFGTAKRIYTNSKFLHTINANLPPPESDVYIGWLTKPDQPTEYIKTGRLVYLDNELFLIYQSDSDLRQYNRVLITKQSNDSQVPGKIVLEGSF